MDYDAVLAQVLALLQREQRVAYRVLKRRFQLDDDLLEDLKDDLIYAKKLAVDEDGRVLVWTGETSIAPPTASPMPSPATLKVSPAQGEAASIVPPTPDAERRQLTVMFCDLVDSTQLASHLDPEEYRDVVRAYHTACTEVIRRYDGHIAQLLGDGLLVYFGYPSAHEDDALRAVRTALGILAAMDDLPTRLPHAQGRTLAVRLGIHTGLVVIGAIGDQGRHEHLALGETPNIAARIEGLAQPKTVAISEATYRLVQGYFACQDLGAQVLRGVPEAMHLYHVLGASGATSRLDIARPRGLTPLVGRESEVVFLLERWAQAKRGQGQVVLLTGEGGVGKSRLVQVLKDHVANEPHVRWECRSAEYAQNTALFPLIELFQRLLRFQAYGSLGQPEAGLTALAEALTLVDKTGERHYEAEIYRLKGALLLQRPSDNTTEAETCFHQALTIARSQQAKSFELRTATSLARLWQQQGKRTEAHDLLAPIYGWFTEGFNTADLQEAKGLLDELEG